MIIKIIITLLTIELLFNVHFYKIENGILIKYTNLAGLRKEKIILF